MAKFPSIHTNTQNHSFQNTRSFHWEIDEREENHRISTFTNFKQTQTDFTHFFLLHSNRILIRYKQLYSINFVLFRFVSIQRHFQFCSFRCAVGFV